MRETVNSLRAYFIVAGVLSGLSALSGLANTPNAIAIVVLLLVLALAVAFIVVGVKLPLWLKTRLPMVKALIWISMALQCLPLLLLIGSNANVASIVWQPLLAIAIGAYLLYSVKRLAAESVKLA